MEQNEEKHILHGVELTQEEWDKFIANPNVLPRPIVLQIFKEHDAKKEAEKEERKRKTRSDYFEGESVIIDPLRRTAVKVDQIMPKYLNYGSFCKVASQCINELVHWMRVVENCAARGNEAKANIQPGMITQSIIDLFTHLKQESVFAMKQYKKLLFDMRVYIYIFNVINDYYKTRVFKNKYLVKNDIILDIFQDRKLEWFDNYRNGKNKAFFAAESTEQDGFEQDFFNALKRYYEICEVHEDVHFTPEIGRETRCKQTGDIDVAYIPEYMNWYTHIKQRTEEEIINQFHFITRNYPQDFIRMKLWKDDNGKLRFKLWANTPYYNEYNYNNDNWDEDAIKKQSNDETKDEITNTNIHPMIETQAELGVNTCTSYINEPVFDTIKILTNIYNSGYKEKVFCSYWNNTCSNTCYVLKSSINNLSDNKYPQNFNIDNALYSNIYKEYLNIGYNINYINKEYLKNINIDAEIIEIDYTSYLCKHDSPPGSVESDKPPDDSNKPPNCNNNYNYTNIPNTSVNASFKRYIIDNSIMI